MSGATCMNVHAPPDKMSRTRARMRGAAVSDTRGALAWPPLYIFLREEFPHHSGAVLNAGVH